MVSSLTSFKSTGRKSDDFGGKKSVRPSGNRTNNLTASRQGILWRVACTGIDRARVETNLGGREREREGEGGRGRERERGE